MIAFINRIIDKMLDAIVGLPVLYRSIVLSIAIIAGAITAKFYFDYKLEVVRITGKEVAQPQANDYVDRVKGVGIGIEANENKIVAKSVK